MVMSVAKWIECTLGELGEIAGGATPSTKCSDYYGGSIPWITPEDLFAFKGRTAFEKI
jgi:Type I restriction modification DNA specificity domain.